MLANFTPKNAIISICEKCTFKCIKKSDWDRHIMTRKHLNTYKILTNNTENAQKNAEEANEFICNCGKKYKHRQSLFTHKKKCNINNILEENEIIEIKEDKPEIIDKDLIMMLIKQNAELLEIVKNGTNNTINSHNKTFNLQVFLNETCKDAMNIMDFIDSIKIQLEDLEDVGKLGYVNGISNIIMKNLKALDVTQRPVHCSDSKRETLYVKDQDKWEKEDENNARLRKAIRRIAYKNTKVIRDWRDIHPDHDNSFSKTSDIYQQIVIESMGGKYYETTDTEAKIIKNIAKHVIIDK